MVVGWWQAVALKRSCEQGATCDRRAPPTGGAGKQSFVVVDGIETYTHTQGYHNIIKHIIKRATYSEDRII